MLLGISGFFIVFLYLLFFQGKTLSLWTFKTFVINKAFVALLPKTYTLEQAEAVRLHVLQFYETADDRGWSDAAVYRISRKIQEMMSDEAITDAEVQTLLTMMDPPERVGTVSSAAPSR